MHGGSLEALIPESGTGGTIGVRPRQTAFPRRLCAGRGQPGSALRGGVQPGAISGEGWWVTEGLFPQETVGSVWPWWPPGDCGQPTVDFVGHHDARDLRPELPELSVPGAQVPVGDLPLHVEHLQRAEGDRSALAAFLAATPAGELGGTAREPALSCSPSKAVRVPTPSRKSPNLQF